MPLTGMDKKELKESKKAYKKAVNLQDAAQAAELEPMLRSELGESWEAFRADVDAFLQNVEKLLVEIEALGSNSSAVFTDAAIAASPLMARAKELGAGTQFRAQEAFKKAAERQFAIRAAQPRGEPEPQEVFYPCLPDDWVSQPFKRGGRTAANPLADIMYQYCQVSLWGEGRARTDRLRALIAEAHDKADAATVDDAFSTAEYWLSFAVPVVRAAVGHDVDTAEEEDALRKLGRPARQYVNRQREKRRNHGASVQARKEHVVQIRGIAAVRKDLPLLPDAERTTIDGRAMRTPTVHPNDITTLAPGTAWTVYLDESYNGEEKEFLTSGDGIMAGVICRDDQPLPLLPLLHCATDSKPELLTAADQAINTVLNHPNCGVLAVPTRAYDVAFGWDDMLASWVDVVVRLLPFPENGEPVKIRFCVEPNGDYADTADFKVLKLVCEKSLKMTFPERARQVSLSFEALPKPSPGQLSHNAYPDIVGHTCLRHREDNTARQRYELSGWSGVCHLNLNPLALSRLLRCFYYSEPLDAKTWSALISHDDIGLFATLSKRFGERARASTGEWEGYLAVLQKHLVSGAIDMELLRHQVDWLARCIPENPLPRKSRLVWLTAQLALANHEGCLVGEPGGELRQEFNALSAELFDEAAPVVCDATLNLAVAYTNGYEFEMALAVIHSLLERDVATVGLANHGKLLSSAGQHFSFLGMGDEAIPHFERALDCFARLSDADERRINLDITRAYLATATMDMRPADARRKLALYLLGDEEADDESLAREAARLAGERRAKFHHHILLRYLVSLPQDDPLRQAYVAQKNAWCQHGVGHPWELIEFYRGLLLPADAGRHLENAYRLAVVEGGPTLTVIAAVIAGSALALGMEGEWSARLSAALDEVKDIPGLVECGRFAALANQALALLPPLELAKKILPFNFR